MPPKKRGRGRPRKRPLTPPASPSPPPEREEKKERKRREVSDADRLVEVFEELAKQANAIRRETYVDGRKKKSDIVMDALKGYIDSLHALDQQHYDGCRNAELECITALIEHATDADTIVQIIPFIQTLMPVIYQNNSTLSKNYVAIRKAISDRYGNRQDIVDLSVKTLHVPIEVALELKQNYAEQVYQRNMDQEQIEDTQILRIIELKQYSPDWAELMVVVALAVGSRMIEIMKVSEYHETEDTKDKPRDPNYIRIIGVAKDREGPEATGNRLEGRRILEKPIIGLTAKDVIRLVTFIRTELHAKYKWKLKLPDGTETKGASKENKQMTNTVHNRVTRATKDLIGHRFTFHNARALYAEMAWSIYAPPSISKVAFYSEVLGHKPQSLTTALSYQRFVVHKKLERADPNLKTHIVMIDEKLTALKKELEEKGFLERTDENLVQFTGEDGKLFTLVKQPNVHNGNIDARMNRLENHVTQLEAHGLKPTYKNLLKLGYGTTIIHLYKINNQLEGVRRMGMEEKKEEVKEEKKRDTRELVREIFERVERKEAERKIEEAKKRKKRKGGKVIQEEIKLRQPKKRWRSATSIMDRALQSLEAGEVVEDFSLQDLT